MYNDFWNGEKWVSQATNEQIGAWVKLIALASNGADKGVIGIGMGIAYSPEQLEKLLGLTPSKYAEFLIFLKSKGAIKTEKGVIYIANWKHYQSEYDRQKQYRLHQKVTPESNSVEVDIEGEGDKDKKKKKTTDPRIKRLIDFFFQEHIRTQKGEKTHINGGKDGTIFQRILTTFTEDEIKARITWFMLFKDKFIDGEGGEHGAGRSVGVFESQLPKYKPEIPKNEPVFRAKVVGRDV